MSNEKISQVLKETAFLLEMQSANPFKIRAFKNGADIIEDLEEDASVLLQEKKLQKIKGIGKGLCTAVEEFSANGSVSEHQELLKELPQSILELRSIPGLGPKKIKTLYEDLAISSVAELEYACNENRLIELKGFGEKSQEKIRKSLSHMKLNRGKVLLPTADFLATEVLTKLQKSSSVEKAMIVGELRRRMEVVASVDILLALKDQKKIKFDFLTKMDFQAEDCKDDQIFIGRDSNGLQLRIFAWSKKDTESFAAKSFRLSASDNFLAKTLKQQKITKLKTEAEILKTIKFPLSEPELWEAEYAGVKKSLPKLVELKDIKGVFHNHTLASDGSHSLEEMVQECIQLGFSYLGVSDHSQSAFYAGGLKEDAIKKQRDEITALKEKYPDFTIFHGIESDILNDGSLDYKDSVLEKFDFVIASVHNNFRMSEKDMTKRVCTALKNPHTTWLGHPTGRLLLGREGFALDMEKVFATAEKYKKAIELNSNPYRLDLDWRHLQAAKKIKLPIGIFPDAHSIHGLKDVQYGVWMARKGGLSAADISNTKTAEEMKQWLQQH